MLNILLSSTALRNIILPAGYLISTTLLVKRREESDSKDWVEIEHLLSTKIMKTEALVLRPIYAIQKQQYLTRN